MKSILCIVGTRPEAIKMAPVIQALKKRPEQCRVLICATGQHREMLTQALTLFQLCPDYNLAVMTPNQNLASLTSRLLDGLEQVFDACKPHWVIAQGDTTTVLAAALAAYYRRISFGHVEAGLRTGDLFRPFPEEFNRRVADLVAARLWAPTPAAREALLREGVAPQRIVVTGNTVVDALRSVAAMPYDWSKGQLAKLMHIERLVLVTAHRRENFGPAMTAICNAVRSLAEAFSEDGVHFAYPVHPNPNVQQVVQESLTGIANVHLLPPLDYLAFVHLLKRAEIALTDSGGIQEEAPSLGVPVLVMRDKTERPEGVAAGCVRLVGTTEEGIVKAASAILRDHRARAAMRCAQNPYGDGKAGERIAENLLKSDDWQ